MPAKTTTAPAADTLADFKVSARRESRVIVDKSAPRASVPEVSDAAYVTRGARLVGRDNVRVPVLVLRDGSSESTLPLAAIGAAIGAVITREEIASLLSES